MVGDLRDECFNNLGKHSFLELTNIPERRYAKEQTVAQILAQVFSLEETKSNDGDSQFTKTRQPDLQRLFKENAQFYKTIRINKYGSTNYKKSWIY